MITKSLPEFDEHTCKPVLPKDQLKDGAYYIGRCRNASVARWSAANDCFYHWREKWTTIYVEAIKHPLDYDVFDVFRVLEELPHSKFVIPIDDSASHTFEGDPADLNQYNHQVWCSCGTRDVCLIHNDDGTVRHPG
jgi:hypothetical protein